MNSFLSIATLTLSYDASTPQKLYYTLENSGGYISTADKTVRNYSEILFVDSLYHNSYSIQSVGLTSFTINLQNNPEKQSYSSSECDTLKYTTSSRSAKGPVEKIKLISGGYGYKGLPVVSGTTSVNGKNLYAVPTSSNIGNIKQTRIINQGFEYSSDKTLQPRAFISPKITLTNTNTIGKIDVLYGGKDYINQPQIVIVDSDSRKVVDSGLLIPSIVGSSISKIDIEVEPKGISDASAEIFTVNNTNGVSIKQVESSNSGIFTCIITTPPTGFSEDPFKIGDKVFIEGIQKYSSDGNGFNSSDYGYRFFTVTNYSIVSGNDDRVTVNAEEFTTNTGIAKTIQDSSGTIVNKSNYPVFDITLKLSTFSVGEKLISNDIERDLEVVLHNTETFKVFGTYELSKGEKIIGKSSGNSAIISELTKYDGRFVVNYSSPKNEGWKTEIGKLNEDYQVLPNNDYYQNMSYSVKSNQTWDTIRTPVNNLIHPVGMKNFSDTEITTSSESGIKTSTNNTIIIKDIIDEKRVDTINIFDFVRDIDVIQGASRFLEFENKSLTNYTEIGSNIV
ncbi:hypothetical protein EB155_06725, partial [archaeon]|nr:hypothetical protein [archaeon]